MIERQKRSSKRKKKKLGKKSWIAIIAIVLIIGAGAYVFRKPLAIMAFDLFLSGQVEKQLQESYAPLGGETEPQQVAQEQGLEPFTMLLLGVDQRDKEPARSDTMIYAVVRPEEEKVLLISIPRDTYTEIVGKGSMDKINHAYAFGGEKMAKDTVENLLGYPADYYAAINFHGLREIVDALGGIELPITKDIVNKEKYHEKFTIKAGKPLYSGEEALNYVRYREDSDFERTKRHQVFLNAMVNRMLKLDQVTKIPELMNMMGENFKTDLAPSKIIDLSKQVLLGSQQPQISGFTIMGEGMRIKGVYYDKANEEDVAFAKEMIGSWIDPETEPDKLITPESRDAEKAETEAGASNGSDSGTSAAQ
ncbi:LCP family protein [Paenibacillus macerans]|uniref:LCP family protein n=1 Tax=Paenibacillus macerans TaxID=44252 RepID=UPI00242FF36A|nr:LCP family protein [Paenibacillus macerans]MBS5914659.1 LCP family protein [Paenibacillus macerans]MEC0136325.1 LCP family protein [Paenibacillus macerans]